MREAQLNELYNVKVASIQTAMKRGKTGKNQNRKQMMSLNEFKANEL